MDSDGLRTFLAVHHADGFSKAALLLHRSQPAISRRIALLEDEIGVPLFERASGGGVLTEAGRALLPHAERVSAALRDAADAIAGLKAEAGPVALAVVGTLANAALTAALKRFAVACPNAQLSLRTATSAEVSALVRRGEATLGLRYFEDRSADLASEVLANEPLCIVCAPGHLLAGTRVTALRELAGERWLAFPERGEARDAPAATIFAEFMVRGVAALDALPVDSLTAQKRLAEAGYGIALLPESSIVEGLAAGSLALISVADLGAANPVVAVTRREGYLSPAAKRLLEILKAALGPS